MNTAGVPTSCQKYQFFVTTNTTGHYPDISLKTLCFVTTNTAGDFLTSCQKYVISWLQMFKHWPFIKTIQWRHTYKCWNMSSERDVTRTDVNVSVVCRNVKYQHVDLQSDLCSTSCSSSWMSERHCVNVVCAHFATGSLFSHSLLKSVNLSSMKEGAGSVTSQTVAETSRVQKINLIRFAYSHILEVFMRKKEEVF